MKAKLRVYIPPDSTNIITQLHFRAIAHHANTVNSKRYSLPTIKPNKINDLNIIDNRFLELSAWLPSDQVGG